MDIRQDKQSIVIGLLFGDEGKGTITDYLCSERKTDYVIRFSGGPQTAHNVVTDAGRHHTFALFGSGTFQGAKTILSQFVLVNPFNMTNEANALWDKIGHDPFEDTFISRNALLLTPLHVAANRWREIQRGASAHGSCGQGIGEARAYEQEYKNRHVAYPPMTVGDMVECWDSTSDSMLLEKLKAYKEYLERTLVGFTYDESLTDIISGYQELMADRPLNIVSDQWIYAQIKNPSNWNVFEGSQGVLLDEDFGFHPHTTWSATTDRNARKLIRFAGADESNYKTVGVTRTYATRHGYGPFPSEFQEDSLHYAYPEKHNAWGFFQGSWRIGALDFPLLEYAVKVNKGIDEIALTHCDLPFDRPINLWDTDIEPVAEKDLDYQEQLTNKLMNIDMGALTEITDLTGLVAALEERLHAPVVIESYGPTDMDKQRTGK